MTRNEYAQMLGVKTSYFNRMCIHGGVRKDIARRLSKITGINTMVFLYESGPAIRAALEEKYGAIPETRGRTPEAAIATDKRRARVHALHSSGLSVAIVAELEGITRERVYQILREVE